MHSVFLRKISDISQWCTCPWRRPRGGYGHPQRSFVAPPGPWAKSPGLRADAPGLRAEAPAAGRAQAAPGGEERGEAQAPGAPGAGFDGSMVQ